MYIWEIHTKENSPASRQQSADLDNNTISVKTLGGWTNKDDLFAVCKCAEEHFLIAENYSA